MLKGIGLLFRRRYYSLYDRHHDKVHLKLGQIEKTMKVFILLLS